MALAHSWTPDAHQLHWKKLCVKACRGGEVDAAKRLAIYAMLANNVYRETARRPHFLLPAEWRLNQELTRQDPHTGLYYEVWEHNPANAGVDQVVVAFRGTDSGRDWLYGKRSLPCILVWHQ